MRKYETELTTRAKNVITYTFQDTRSDLNVDIPIFEWRWSHRPFAVKISRLCSCELFVAPNCGHVTLALIEKWLAERGLKLRQHDKADWKMRRNLQNAKMEALDAEVQWQYEGLFEKGRIVARQPWQGQENWYQFISRPHQDAMNAWVADVDIIRAESFEEAEQILDRYGWSFMHPERDGMFAVLDGEPSPFDWIRFIGDIGRPRARLASGKFLTEAEQYRLANA